LVTVSIVLYNNDKTIVERAINSFFNTKIDFILYLIDNSPLDSLRMLKTDERIIYLHNPGNPGFGAAHNIAIDLAINNGSQYHFIVNPDIYFNDDVLTPMVNYMADDIDIGMIMPEILFPDGSIQNLPKLLPSPASMLLRKLNLPTGLYRYFIDRYELRGVSREKIYNAPILSGCFTLLNLKAIKEIGTYDDAFFMYFEDWDLSRRMAEKYKTIYFPVVSVYHEYHSGANKSYHLFEIFIKSAFHYFNKWGWFLDANRSKINAKTLTQFK
jgi:GT2 family glycosyltransferase